MAAGYVSGETMLRPIRMGLAIMPGSAAGLQRAVELATGAWGGQAFPIFEAGRDDHRVLRMAAAMGVDCLIPVSDDDELKVLAKAPGFDWVVSWKGRSPFNRDQEGPAEHLLPASALYDWYRLSRLPLPPVHHVSWPQDHALADLLAVWFGRFGDDHAGQADLVTFGAIAQGCPLGPGLPLPPWPMSIASQLTVTMQDVFQQPFLQSRGVVVTEPANVSHLVSFWNLRAAGQEVFPWAESRADLLEEPLRQWLDQVASEASPESGRPRLSVWLPRGAGIPARLSELLDNGRFRVMPEAQDMDLHGCGPLMTSHVRRFTADTSQSGETEIPLPILDFLPRRASWSDPGMVAADIEVRSESPDLAGDTGMIVPAARCVAPYLRAFIPFTRPRARGRVIPVRVSNETVSLVPVRADLLAQKLASAAGYQLSLTENGRRVHHRIRLLGGVTEDSLANQPAVRAVVRQALKSPYGANAETLVATAGKESDGWPGRSRRRRGYKDYPAQVIGELAERGILQPLACVKCPNCASTVRVPPAQLGAPVRCELCSASVPFGTYIANSPQRPAAWAMRVMPALDEAHFSETIPVMAALSVFHAACDKGFTSTGMTYLVGAELVTSAMKCEIDFIILIQDAELPAVIISEAKAGNPGRPAQSALLSSDDLSHLEAVQDSLRALGIDCWICFATTRPALEQSEIDLLRHSCERSLAPVFDFMGSLLPVLPIVLVGEDLSVPVLDERHPATRVHGHFPRLPGLGKDTCQRQLGLADIDYTADSHGNWQARPRWA
jgi:hypothetical protein